MWGSMQLRASSRTRAHRPTAARVSPAPKTQHRQRAVWRIAYASPVPMVPCLAQVSCDTVQAMCLLRTHHDTHGRGAVGISAQKSQDAHAHDTLLPNLASVHALLPQRRIVYGTSLLIHTLIAASYLY